VSVLCCFGSGFRWCRLSALPPCLSMVASPHFLVDRSRCSAHRHVVNTAARLSGKSKERGGILCDEVRRRESSVVCRRKHRPMQPVLSRDCLSISEFAAASPRTLSLNSFSTSLTLSPVFCLSVPPPLQNTFQAAQKSINMVDKGTINVKGWQACCGCWLPACVLAYPPCVTMGVDFDFAASIPSLALSPLNLPIADPHPLISLFPFSAPSTQARTRLSRYILPWRSHGRPQWRQRTRVSRRALHSRLES
jgi:hypothetical protein